MFSFPAAESGILGAAVALLFSYLAMRWFLHPTTHSNGLRLPPISPASAISNFRNKINQRGLTRIRSVRAQGLIVQEQQQLASNDSEAFKYGTAFRMAKVPFVDNSNLFIYVTDFKLARLVLLGDKNTGILEGIKKNNLTSFNIANRSIGNMFTTNSLDARREKARKQIAPAFST